MESPDPKPIASFEDANDHISWISGYETEAEVESAAKQIVEYCGLQSFVFSALFRSGDRENYRYLVGCELDWCFLYDQNKVMATSNSQAAVRSPQDPVSSYRCRAR